MIRLIIFSLFLTSIIQLSNSIHCYIGYGQRGLVSSHEIMWTRDCPNTNYCWEVYTDDITKVQKLIDYPWDSYYSEFFIRSCGGDFGTDLDYHPYKNNPKYFRNKGYVKLSVTFPPVVTGQGGTEEFGLNWICRKEYCASGTKIKVFSVLTIISITVLSVWLSL